MRLLVYIKDGRTCYRITGRGHLAALVRAEPWHENRAVTAEKGLWNSETGEYFWAPIQLRHIARGAISHVEEDRAGYTSVQEAEAA